jgi:hypothetical protein
MNLGNLEQFIGFKPRFKFVGNRMNQSSRGNKVGHTIVATPDRWAHGVDQGRGPCHGQQWRRPKSWPMSRLAVKMTRPAQQACAGLTVCGGGQRHTTAPGCRSYAPDCESQQIFVKHGHNEVGSKVWWSLTGGIDRKAVDDERRQSSRVRQWRELGESN